MENSFLSENQLEPEAPKLNRKIYIYVVCILGFFIICYFLFLSAPFDFVPGSIVKIEKGMGLRSISLVLKKQHLIRSRVAFESFVILFGGDKHIQSADYFFEDKFPVYKVAWRIAKGDYNMAPISITIPEGFDVNQMADAFDLQLSDFNKIQFLEKAKELEGYLFPDTYFFLTNDDDSVVLRSMSENFKKKIAPILPEITASGKTQKEIIIMASIVEREAKGDADRGVISGILWNRIRIGMPLQVDAAMETYKTKGLPKGPICNPGLEAIEAAIHPIGSSYLYYLHDKEGIIHYAKTFAEHTKNVSKYLR